MGNLHPAAAAVLIGIGAIGVAGLIWAAVLSLIALRQAYRARQAQVDWLLWEDEVNPQPLPKPRRHDRPLPWQVHDAIAQETEAKRRADGQGDE